MDIETLAKWSQAGAFTALFSIVGWCFVYANSRSLARQSEVNTITASIEKMLQELSDESNSYWLDAAGKKMEVGRAELFNAFVSFRCNFIEDKVRFMNEKCRSFMRGEVNHEKFEDEIVDLIAKIRDASTLDSERPAEVHNCYERVIEVNYLSQELYLAIYEFLRVRYMSGSDKRYLKLGV